MNIISNHLYNLSSKLRIQFGKLASLDHLSFNVSINLKLFSFYFFVLNSYCPHSISLVTLNLIQVLYFFFKFVFFYCFIKNYLFKQILSFSNLHAIHNSDSMLIVLELFLSEFGTLLNHLVFSSKVCKKLIVLNFF